MADFSAGSRKGWWWPGQIGLRISVRNAQESYGPQLADWFGFFVFTRSDSFSASRVRVQRSDSSHLDHDDADRGVESCVVQG